MVVLTINKVALFHKQGGSHCQKDIRGLILGENLFYGNGVTNHLHARRVPEAVSGVSGGLNTRKSR
jgi:hypothetical protein